ncbi:hypothetical protein L9F63_008270, partial [Diploptera punctata]
AVVYDLEDIIESRVDMSFTRLEKMSIRVQRHKVHRNAKSATLRMVLFTVSCCWCGIRQCD